MMPITSIFFSFLALGFCLSHVHVFPNFIRDIMGIFLLFLSVYYEIVIPEQAVRAFHPCIVKYIVVL